MQLRGFKVVRTAPIETPQKNAFAYWIALNWANQGDEVLVRGVRDDDRSEIWTGEIQHGCEGHYLTLGKPVMSLADWPRTTRESGSRVVFGLEDPTFLPLNYNPFCGIPHHPGMLCTEAFYQEGHAGPLGASLLYVETGPRWLLTATTETSKRVLLNAGMVRAAWQGECPYNVIDMVKEGEVRVFQDGGKTPAVMLFEIGADGKSRLVRGDVDPKTKEVVNIRLALDAKPGTWYEEHVSTAGPVLQLLPAHGGRDDVMLINGRSENRWQVGWAKLDTQLNIVHVGEPIIMPQGSDRGSDDQHIAFASGARIASSLTQGFRGRRIHVLWHLNDKHPYLTVLEPVYE